MTSTMMVVLVVISGDRLADDLATSQTPYSRITTPHPRSAAPDPHFWGLCSAERGGVAMLGVGLVGVALGSPAAATVGPLLLSALMRERGRRRRQRTELAHADSLLEFVDAVAAGLRSGGSLSGSVATAARGASGSSQDECAHPGLQRVVAGVGAGRTLPVAFADAFSVGAEIPVDRHRSGRADEELLTVTVLALEASGGSAADAMDRVGDALRERCAARADARTQAQQAISSAAVMAALPLLFGLAAAVAEPGVGHLYRSTWLGAACSGSAVALTILGWEWQRRLIEVLR